MKYLTITPIVYALNRIVEGGVTHEHRTSSATSALLTHYFPVNKFLITPEQTQFITNKKPDYSIEKVLNIKKAVMHVYVEVKSIVSSAYYDAMLDQICTSVGASMEHTDVYSVYVIIMKATKIGFYIFHNLSELDEHDVPNYLGVIPLTFKMLPNMIGNVNYGEMSLIEHLRYITDNNHIPTDSNVLHMLGVEASRKITHPHIWDLLNKDHVNHIHDIFMAMAEGDPHAHIKV